MARRQRQLSGYCTEHITQLQFYKHAIIQGQSREQGAMHNNIVASHVKLLNMTKKQTIQLFEERKVRTVWEDEHRSGLIKP